MRTIIGFLEAFITSFWGVVKACMTMPGLGSGIAAGAAQEVAPADGQGGVAHVLSVFAELRPLLVALSVIRIIPANGRALLSAFIKGLDALTLTANPDFKASKDV